MESKNADKETGEDDRYHDGSEERKERQTMVKVGSATGSR